MVVGNLLMACDDGGFGMGVVRAKRGPGTGVVRVHQPSKVLTQGLLGSTS